MPPKTSRLSQLLCGAVLGLAVPGCAVFERKQISHDPCTPDQIMVERGEEFPVLDGVGWAVGIPGKVLLWNRRVDNHHISAGTEEQLVNYMAQNGLYDTKVRLNQYNPGDEWRRLVKNQHVAPGWKYTFGAIDTLAYTIFPGRIFGGDRYSPYTNSVHVYSDVPSLAQLPAAYAKDVNTRVYPGTYVFTQSIAGLNLIHETINTRDVLADTESNSSPDEQREALDVLSPRYGLALGGTVGSFVNLNPATGAIELVGLLGGHAVGRYRSSQIPGEQDQPYYSRTATPSETEVQQASHESESDDQAVP